MTDVDLKEQINLLVRLQALDTQIYSFQQEKTDMPFKLKALEDRLLSEKDNLTQLERQGLDLQKRRKEKELELASKEEEARKMQAQLYQLKTNKEYSAKLKEIETVRADASVLEDAILALLDETDKLNNQISKEKQNFAEEQKKADAEKKNLDLRAKEIDDSLTKLNSQRNQIVQKINPSILVKYEKILNNRAHLAIVKVDNNTCQGCYMNVPPQVINLIKMYDKIVICEACQRILYIDDEGIGDLH